MDMTHQRGNTTVGALVQNVEAKAQEETSMVEKDRTVPPRKRQPLLDNGSGKPGHLNNSDSSSATQCHATQLLLSSNGKSHRSSTAGPPTHQRRPSAGAIIAPPSPEDRRIDDRNSQVIQHCHSPAHHACTLTGVSNLTVLFLFAVSFCCFFLLFLFAV